MIFTKMKTRLVSAVGLLIGSFSLRLLKWYIKGLRVINIRRAFSIILRNGIKLFVNLDDPGISRDLLLHQWREEVSSKFFQENLKPGQLILDVGSNIGFYALMEAKIVGESGTVYAIEPEEVNYQLLLKNIRANHFSDTIKPFRCGISNESGVKAMHVANRSNLHTFNRVPVMDHYVKFKGTRNIEVFSLGDFVAANKIDPKKIDVIRMDIEGHEYFALDGMMELLNAAGSLLFFLEIHPKLIKELNGENTYESFILKLESCGFKLVEAAYSLSSRVDEKARLENLRELLPLHEAVEVLLKK